MRSLVRFIALPVTEQRLLVVAAGLLTAVRLGLWVLPFRTVHAAIRARAAAPGLRARRGGPPPERIAWAVEAAARLVPEATCLVRALAAQALLARHGHRSQLRLGVARDPGRAFEAHAWLEGDGQVLIGRGAEERYVPLPALEPRP
jgi:hypothetical protein